MSRKARGPLFGTDLAVVMAAQDPSLGDVPIPITRCIRRIEKSLDEDGIFRVGGNHRRKNDIKALFDTQGDANLDEADIHDVGDLFKTYLRNLPDPPLTYVAADSFLRAQKIVNESERLVTMQGLMANLPSVNQALVTTVVAFLLKVAAHSAANQMTKENLALVFGPNMISLQPTGNPEADAKRMLSDSELINGVLLTMLSFPDQVFRLCRKWSSLRNELSDGSTSSSLTGAGSSHTSPPRGGALSPNSSLNVSVASPQLSPKSARAVDALLTDTVAKTLFTETPPPPPPLSITDAHGSGTSSGESRRRSDSGQGAGVGGGIGSGSGSGSGSSSVGVGVGGGGEGGGRSQGFLAAGPLVSTTDTPVWAVSDIPLLEVECRRLDLDIEMFETEFGRRHRRMPVGAERQVVVRAEQLRASFQTALQRLYAIRASEAGSSSRPSSVSGSGDTPLTAALIDVILADPLAYAMARLREAQREAGRPAELERCTDTQRAAEKSAIKRELRAFDLAFEARHGAPPAKADKEAMRPLYERYKSIKVATEGTSTTTTSTTTATTGGGAATTSTATSSGSAAPVLGSSAQRRPSSDSAAGTLGPAASAMESESGRVVAASGGRGGSGGGGTTASVDAANTKPGAPSSTGGSGTAAAPSARAPSPVTVSGNSASGVDTSRPIADHAAYLEVKAQKRVLQVKLHAYQRDFMAKNGRGVQYVEDRLPVQDDYMRYKLLKSRLAEYEAANSIQTTDND